MEQNNILELDCFKEDVEILIESTEKFKRVHRIDFKTEYDNMNNKFIINLEDVSPNSSFLIGYYYGALQFIKDKKK